MDAESFELEIITRKKSKIIPVEWVEVESPTGNFVVGPYHLPIVSLLKERGVLIYKEAAGKEISIDTFGGIIKVENNKAVVLLQNQSDIAGF